MAVFREGRMVGHRTVEPEPTKPPVGEVQGHLLAQSPLRADAEAITHDQRSSAPDRSMAGLWRCRTAPVLASARRVRQTDQSIAVNALRHGPFERKLVEQCVL